MNNTEPDLKPGSVVYYAYLPSDYMASFSIGGFIRFPHSVQELLYLRTFGSLRKYFKRNLLCEDR